MTMTKIPATISVSQETEEQPDLRSRALDLLRTEIDFIPNLQFRSEAVSDSDFVDATLEQRSDPSGVSAKMPAHLERMCSSNLLTPEQETALFREMNYLKYRASALRSQLDPEDVDLQMVSTIETVLRRAQLIRDHLIQANMRLVMSIVKKFVSPQQSFDDLLSDGIVTLMRAVEKFDYDRGFRFSTYAYRSIAREVYRTVMAAHKEEARMTREAEEWAFEQEDDRSASSMTEQAWNDLRRLMASMLDRLNRRERFIIRSRYALGAHRRVRTFQYLADKLGISKERVRQLEQGAVAKLKSMAAEFEMDDVLGAAMA